MPLDAYARACIGIKEELLDSLSEHDVAEIKKDDVILTLAAWQSWFESNFAVVQSYVASTPAQRNKQKKWQDPQTRRRLTLAGIQMTQSAHELLHGIEEFDLHPGGSYRDMSQRAGKAYFEILWRAGGVTYWPFEGKNPFYDP